ncbi:microtubule-associated protein 9-like isoform X2 [Xenia sp. Carnegie-2017]|nr:microtubule-associated protein 9-like isoform X2 [Xenia sp. Carnegie-2017]
MEPISKEKSDEGLLNSEKNLVLLLNDNKVDSLKSARQDNAHDIDMVKKKKSKDFKEISKQSQDHLKTSPRHPFFSHTETKPLEHEKSSLLDGDLNLLFPKDVMADKLFDSARKISHKSVSFEDTENDHKEKINMNYSTSSNIKKPKPEILPRNKLLLHSDRRKSSDKDASNHSMVDKEAEKFTPFLEYDTSTKQEHTDHDKLEDKVLMRERRNIALENTNIGKGSTSDMFEEHVTPKNDHVIAGVERKIRSPMKAHKAVEEMTKSPHRYEFLYESRDSPQTDPFFNYKERVATITNLQSAVDEDDVVGGRSNFTSSRVIRDAVYSQWLQEKEKKKKEVHRKKVEEKRKEAEKIKAKLEKEVMARKAFEAWSSKKDDINKTDAKKKKELKDKELGEKREMIVKKQDAKKFFESWKNKKDEILKENFKEKKTRAQEEKRKKTEDHVEKVDIAKKAYEKWKSQKDEKLKTDARTTRHVEKLKASYEKEMELEKRQECERTFQEFLRKKGTGKRPPASPTLTQRAWCPGGLTRGTNLIPEKIQPVITPPRLNRSRSFSGLTTRTTSSFGATKQFNRGW